jgi:N-acetylmuramoyl-L-alanine amidase
VPDPVRVTKAAANSASALADVATLSNQPNEVRATKRPTTAPVVASVAGTTRAPQPNSVAASTTTSNPPPATTRRRSAKPSAARVADDVPPVEAGAPGIAAAPATSAEHATSSMMRALGLKINRIVIDAGHGGHDSGTLGPGGIEEKDVVLDVALRLGKLLKDKLGAQVVYTRSDDTFIPLETRTAIANQAQADLFISVHANSSPDTSARGVEVYYLNFTSSADALEVAARENAVSNESIHQLSDLVKKIALQDKISESKEFADDVDQSLYAGLEEGNAGLKDRGVKKAPFVVLIGANMPSILAEISFLTNPQDAQELREGAYRERIAESLYRGVARYVSSMNGMRVAKNGE